jgi:hypothetical protein
MSVVLSEELIAPILVREVREARLKNISSLLN